MRGQTEHALGKLLGLRDGETFEPIHHIYRTTKGVRVRSVTEILNEVGLAPDLEEISPFVLARAGQRGTNLHNATWLALEDDLDWETLDPALHATVRYGVDLLREANYEPIAVECPMIHSAWDYSGTLDLFCRLDKRLAVVDGKSGLTPQGYVAAQNAGYIELIEDRLGRVKDGIESWLLKFQWREGRAKLVKLVSGEQDFMAALRVVRAKTDQIFWQSL